MQWTQPLSTYKRARSLIFNVTETVFLLWTRLNYSVLDRTASKYQIPQGFLLLFIIKLPFACPYIFNFCCFPSQNHLTLLSCLIINSLIKKVFPENTGSKNIKIIFISKIFRRKCYAIISNSHVKVHRSKDKNLLNNLTLCYQKIFTSYIL